MSRAKISCLVRQAKKRRINKDTIRQMVEVPITAIVEDAPTDLVFNRKRVLAVLPYAETANCRTCVIGRLCEAMFGKLPVVYGWVVYVPQRIRGKWVVYRYTVSQAIRKAIERFDLTAQWSLEDGLVLQHPHGYRSFKGMAKWKRRQRAGKTSKGVPRKNWSKPFIGRLADFQAQLAALG